MWRSIQIQVNSQHHILYAHPCIQDSTHTLLHTRPFQVDSQGHTHTHTPLHKRPSQVDSQGHTHTHTPLHTKPFRVNRPGHTQCTNQWNFYRNSHTLNSLLWRNYPRTSHRQYKNAMNENLPTLFTPMKNNLHSCTTHLSNTNIYRQSQLRPYIRRYKTPL